MRSKPFPPRLQASRMPASMRLRKVELRALVPFTAFHLLKTRKRNNSCRVADYQQDAKVTSVTCEFGAKLRELEPQLPRGIAHHFSQFEAHAFPAVGQAGVGPR